MPSLPEHIKPNFWDTDFAALDLDKDRDFVAMRILANGSWNDLNWLRRNLSNDTLKAIIQKKSGRGLDPKRLRYWQLILDLPKEQVDDWIESYKSSAWGKRTIS